MEDLLLLQYTPFTVVAVHSNKKVNEKKKVKFNDGNQTHTSNKKGKKAKTK